MHNAWCTSDTHHWHEVMTALNWLHKHDYNVFTPYCMYLKTIGVCWYLAVIGMNGTRANRLPIMALHIFLYHVHWAVFFSDLCCGVFMVGIQYLQHTLPAKNTVWRSKRRWKAASMAFRIRGNPNSEMFLGEFSTSVMPLTSQYWDPEIFK